MNNEYKTKKNPKIVTTSNRGGENGFLVPILNIHENFIDEKQWPKQVYLTVAAKGEIKGPHLHKKRWGLFTCIKGNIKIVIRNEDGSYVEKFSGEEHGFSTIQIPAGIPSALVNIGETEAYILNMPSPAWHPEDLDDWDVEFLDYNFKV